VLKQPLWLGLLGLLVGTVWVYAQAQGPSGTSTPSTPVQSEARELGESRAPPAAKASADASAPRWYGPEIWRLPPVGGSDSKIPPALAMSPAETIPAPAPSVPIANAPSSLSGILSIDEPIKIKSSEPELEKPWDGSFDLGLDGSEGNSETFNFRFGFHASRKTESNILTLGLDYNKSTASTVPTTNRLYFDGRFEWLIHETRWSWFVHDTVEYDEFQSFNVRDTSDAGLGYRLIKDETNTLIGRLGAGFSHEYGGPENGEFVPEMVFGVQLERQISKRQKLLGAVEYAPDVADFLRYRIRTQAALEVLLDEERNLSLRMGVLDRYSSQPNGVRPNDLDYAMVLIWRF
jgi:hypothetical protein